MPTYTHPTLTRRHLLAGMATTGVGLFGGFGPLRKLANASTIAGSDQHFIFCYFSGGWDLLLGLDPRDPDVFRPELIGDTLIQPAYGTIVDPTITPEPVVSSVPGMEFGPYIGNLVNWADRMAVVRGMSMDTLTHQVGRRRFLTGKAPIGLQARGSSFGTILAAQLGIEEPVPQISARVEGFNIDQPTYASALQVDGVDDLVTVLAPGAVGLDAAANARIDALLEDHRACDTVAASPTMISALDQREAAQTLVDQALYELFDFGASTPEMEAIRDQYGFSRNDLSSAGAQAAMAVTALTEGISRVVTIRAANSLDSHDNWAQEHGSRLRPGFDVIAAMAADLDSRPYGNDGATWLDHTTIIAFSEFSRTPLLNSRQGRDHALMNACMLLGGGIPGGTVIGASSDVGMNPQGIDLATGAVVAGGEVIRPEHVLRTLLTRAGVTDDIADLRVDPIGALL